MNKIKCFTFVFALLIALPCLAQEQSDKQNIQIMSEGINNTICISTILEDTSKIVKNPGNCPIEILRRLGRVLAKTWENDNTSIKKSGTIMINKYLGTPKFLASIPEKYLSDKQKKECEKLIDNHKDQLFNLLSEFNAASEAITIRAAFDMPEIKSNIKKIIDSDQNIPSVPKEEKAKIKDTIFPIIDAFSDAYGVLSISENGIFGRTNIDSDNNRLSGIISIKNLTINNYVDEEPLIILAQTHGSEDSSSILKRLESIPSMPLVKQMIASAGLDFEKDIFYNYAEESILYINLTPTGEKLIPDIRWVALVPSIDKLKGILPNLKNLCVQFGIFVNNIESSIPNKDVIKINHFITNDYGVYAAIEDKFCILSSTKEGIEAAINHLKNLSNVSKEDKFKDCNLYFRVKTSDLNVQLQQFLQSPLLRDQKIPPITNLTFLNDMNDITAKTKVSNNRLEMILDIPFIKKNK